jgi:hypothetical protein
MQGIFLTKPLTPNPPWVEKTQDVCCANDTFAGKEDYKAPMIPDIQRIDFSASLNPPRILKPRRGDESQSLSIQATF